MLDVTSLYAEHPNDGDQLRYGKKVEKSGHRVPESGELRKPVVVFNITCNCTTQEQKVGLRMTLTQHNVEDLGEIFQLIKEEGIQQVCFYHLAYAERGKAIQKIDLAPWERRTADPWKPDPSCYFTRRERESGQGKAIHECSSKTLQSKKSSHAPIMWEKDHKESE